MKASGIMTRAGEQLLDSDHVRWELPELAWWIEEAVSNTVLVKPSASSKSMDINLVAGTRQKLPDDQRIVTLLDVVRNKSGRMVKPVSRDSLDTQEPRWHDSSVVPFRAEVRQFVFDTTIPREYLVYPGNDGTGIVEATVSFVPPPVSTLVSSGSDVNNLNTWNVDVGLPDEYQSAVLDYVLYRAFLKEEPAATPGRAVTHYQAYATSLGIQSQVETANSPNRKR